MLSGEDKINLCGMGFALRRREKCSATTTSGPTVESCESESVQNAFESAIVSLRHWLVSLEHSRSYKGVVWSAFCVEVTPNNDQTTPGDPVQDLLESLPDSLALLL